MKTIIKSCIISNTFLLCFMIGWTGTAQELIIKDGTARYEDEDYPAVEIYLEPATKDVKKAWKDFLDDRYDVRLRGIGFLVNKDVLSAEGVDFEQVSPERMDFYTRVVEENNMTKMQVFASKGYDINIGLDNDYREYYNMKGIVQNFLDTYLRNYYEEKVEEAQKRVSELEETQQDNRKDIADNEQEINRLREENTKLAQQIREAENNWTEARDELAQRRQTLDNILRELASSNNPVYYNTNYKDNKY